MILSYRYELCVMNCQLHLRFSTRNPEPETRNSSIPLLQYSCPAFVAEATSAE